MAKFIKAQKTTGLSKREKEIIIFEILIGL